ncbi:hypothetical protein BN7_544 [Wickerhamomyces ciferrii]|uniref:Uncharacterized protein n=1 Tax=Wickerhamomyces ciferrii (strain ATCC 14091 / BCRC 22168 / CBS 111 / JCM 3599 / NBRC 0793 / NRRL Y-1031 F-60-10) TaxID=1206466 RepID=K0KFJ8_WICCF|nr:uncharacterized protein BN7_544 [Wickerhamomyces ciferrii]CCH41007.1 hypothetical protein BN7_544 [Wickerhamomyces ciferrii]
MQFVNHSPRADRAITNADITLRENKRLFSPKSLGATLEQQRSPKRKLTDDADHMKRSRSDELKIKHDNDLLHCHGDDWPVFLHPEGGYIQQSPYGNIHIIKDANSERSSIDKTINLDTFSTKIPQSKPIPETPKKKSSVPLAYSRLPLPYSPSSEVESYMVEGYQQELNKSYDVHKEDIVNVNYNLYDHHNEDAHLNEVTGGSYNEDFDMIL